VPSSLRFVLVLLLLAAITGVASVAVIYRQDADRTRTTAEELTGGNAKAGKAAFAQYGCGSCHQIDGIPGAAGMVGPALGSFAGRSEFAGHRPNQPDSLISFIRRPQEVVPGGGMPDQDVSESAAKDIAAYLYTLKPDS
jgi:cytochrome c2